ncbi:uncharacterized protein BYT42DRAFT_242275 [Radiomyces spectabilis]|uniref:uncharacterized protein n=1 Tax=Radiomyces spectabilis TaxID=64574 RepID=UPI00221EE074|nr:uncharacterized protein BYT42DRAFT_242275 [Radiomyces spectabilis]KAI8388661.1 hypothetical protein BYT42DRAFT_242275 [Radiomyces spectabilis]
MQHHWKVYHEKSISPHFHESHPIDPQFSTLPNEMYSLNDAMSQTSDIVVPALDEALVSFVLVLMVQLLHQSHAISHGDQRYGFASSTGSNGSLERTPTIATRFPDPYAKELATEIYRTTGRILYYVSASNWNTYYGRIKEAVQFLGTTNDMGDITIPELRLLECSCLTRQRLHTVLSELSPHFLHMKFGAKLQFSHMIRKAIWKWIECYPSEFAEVCNSEKRLLGGSELLFDMCSSAADNTKNKTILWPLQTILLVLSPDLLLQAFLDKPSAPNNRRTAFLGTLRTSLRSSRAPEIAAVCYVDLCKAATYVPPTEDSVLRHIAADIADDLRDKLWTVMRPTLVDPLPNSGYPIDQPTLLTDYLVAMLRLNPSNTLQACLSICYDRKAAMMDKQALIKACLVLAQDDQRLPWNPSFNSMYASLSPGIRSLFADTVTLEIGNDVNGLTSTPINGSETHGRAELMHDILRLFRTNPNLALSNHETNSVEENIKCMKYITKLLQHGDKRISLAAGECLVKLHGSCYIEHWGTAQSLMTNFWRISSSVVYAIARQILEYSQNEDRLKSRLLLLIKVFTARGDFMKKGHQNTAAEGADVKERLQACVALEVALLVSLCSSDVDICTASLRCINYLCAETRLADEEGDPQLRQITLISNISIYEDLSSDNPMVFLGRKAQQKRIWKHLRMIVHSTPGNLAAWEEAWNRWSALTPLLSRSNKKAIEEWVEKNGNKATRQRNRAPPPIAIIANKATTDINDEQSIAWHNYTGFLAALGGCCIDTEEEGDTKRNKRSSRVLPASQPLLMVDQYLREMVELLTSDNIFVRESVKDTLGGDLSPRLYPILFKHLENGMMHCFDSVGEALPTPQNSLFVEQAVLVLKLILIRMNDTTDCLLNVDYGSLIQLYANYLNKLSNDYTSLSIKIRMCRLIHAAMTKRDQIVISNEIRLRNKLLGIVAEWTSDFKLKPGKNATVQDEQLHQDLDLLCLKAMVGLLYQLPLQPPDSVRQADIQQAKGRLFYKYFSYLSNLLNRCRMTESDTASNYSLPRTPSTEASITSKETYQDWTSMKELTILAMSNLLSANVETGLKYSFAMGYHEDPQTRTAFIQVLTNILNQGTEFETLAENVTSDRYEKLVDMLVDSDLEIAMSLCDVCPSSEIAAIAEVLLLAFESRNKAMQLLKALIEREVSSTEYEPTLFRSTTIATRVLSIFAKTTCNSYIRTTLLPAMEKINQLDDEMLTWQLDPQKLTYEDDVLRNKDNVIRATEILLDAICSSASEAPREFREELSLISDAVSIRYPEAKYIAVGSFVFLRLFSPAILTPENIGFPKKALPRSNDVRRLLLQATRVMQNLANNVLFGAKETHMIILNDFLTENLYKITNFLREISTCPPAGQGQITKATVEMDQNAYVRLHCFLAENLERMSRDLSTRKLKSSRDTQSLLEWKKTLDRLSNLLGQLGRPSDIPLTDLSSSRHTAIRAQNIFFEGGVSRGGRPVFYLISRHIHADSMDFELLVYYMIRVMEPSLDSPFELLFDLTLFTTDCAIPAHWFTLFFQLILSEMNDHLTHLHLFNSNSYLLRFFGALPQAIANKFVKRTLFSGSLQELYERIAPSEVSLPKSTFDIEREQSIVFSPVMKRVQLKSSVPVVVKIGNEHVQVITVRKQELSYNFSAVMKDIYRIEDIEDIISMSSPKHDNGAGGELMIRCEHGKASVILSSSKRDAMVNLLRYNKQRCDSLKPNAIHEQSIRPGDVPGRLLNMALLNISSRDPSLRLAAYNLLYSLSLAFHFDVEGQLLTVKDLCIPFNSMDFVVGISESLAATEIPLTLEFLHECLIGISKSSESMQLLCLHYMAPWLRNLGIFTQTPYERNKHMAKIKEMLRMFMDLTVNHPKMYRNIQEKIWKKLGRIETMTDLLLDALIDYSIESGIGTAHAEVMADTVVTISGVYVRGKLINRMRKVLRQTSISPCINMSDHSTWPQIAILLRFLLMVSFNNIGSIKLYLPELFHIIILLISTGPTFTRSSVHELTVNVIHTLCTQMPLSQDNMKKLQLVLHELCGSKCRIAFGLTKHHASAFTINNETLADSANSVNLNSIQYVTSLLLEAMEYGASTRDIANTWKARWMGLVASTAFHFNPAVQPRTFVVLGCLAREETDDDLVYQILTALRGALAVFDENDATLINSIMMCLSNVINSLPMDSMYLKSLFWLAIGLVQMDHAAIFADAVKFLQAVLRALDSRKMFIHASVVDVLMSTRVPFADIALELDAACGVSFESHFSFAVAGILLKGLNTCEPRDIVLQCLTTFLEIDLQRTSTPGLVDAQTLGYVAGLLPAAAKEGNLRKLLRLAGLSDIDLDQMEFSIPYVPLFDVFYIPDNITALLLVSLLVMMLGSMDSEAERVFLYSFLAEAASSIPEVFSLVYEPLLSKVNQVVSSSQNGIVIEAVKNIMMIACYEPAFDLRQSRHGQAAYLEELGFASFSDPSFGMSNSSKSSNAPLVIKLLERILE